MRVIEPGSRYELAAGNHLNFLKKWGRKIIRHGTTNEEVVEVLVDRETKAYETLPCRESIRALYLLREALATFRLRTARRLAAKVEGTHQPRADIFKSADAPLSSAVGVDEIDYAPIRTEEALTPGRPDEFRGSIPPPRTAAPAP